MFQNTSRNLSLLIICVNNFVKQISRHCVRKYRGINSQVHESVSSFYYKTHLSMQISRSEILSFFLGYVAVKGFQYCNA